MLGVLLGLDKGRLDGIEEQYRNVADNCMMEMLDAWLKTNPSSNEKQLEDALKELYPARTAHHGKLQSCMYLHQLMHACVCVRTILSTGGHEAAIMTISHSTQRQIANFKKRFAFLAKEVIEFLKKSHSDPESLMVLLNDLLKIDLNEPLMIEQPVATHGELFCSYRRSGALQTQLFSSNSSTIS